MTENNKDQIVIEEEPVVDVDSNNEGVSENAVNSNGKYITIGVSIAISVLVYIFIFSGGSDTDVVDPNQIVTDTKTATQGKPTIDNIDSVIGIDYNDNINNTVNENLLKLPELPALPENVTQNIEQQIKETKQAEKGEDTFTAEEVDAMINSKLKSFEDEMKKIRDESEKLAKELEQRKLQEELEKQEKKRLPTFGKTPTSPLDAPPIDNTQNNVPPINTDNQNNIPPALGGTQDPLQGLDEQKKEEERQLLIAQRKRVIQERRGATMFKMQGGGGGEGTHIEADSIIITDKDSLKNVQEAETEIVTTKTADLSRTITQGKIISAVLESAIDTDVQNQVRAVVSRDIYSDMGKNILIPKGSRVIGSYQAVTSATVARLDIVWTRIIRADGLNITLSANSADRLGRGGVPGELDNKYTQMIKNAFLSSVVTIGSAALVDKITDTVTTTTTTGTETATTTSATNQAIIDATQNFGDEMQSIVDALKEESPTIRIAQGTKLNIVVNQDLVLPIYKQKKK